MRKNTYDYVIIGAGFYGMHAASFLSNQGMKVAVIECDSKPFSRASYANQARVHLGYHYPRSLQTAQKTQAYFKQFNDEYGFAIEKSYQKIYAISRHFSYTNANQFEKFCKSAQIPCQEIQTYDLFNELQVERAYKTTEYTYDARILSDYLSEQLRKYQTAFYFGQRVEHVDSDNDSFYLRLGDGTIITSKRVLNATFSALNQVNNLFSVKPERIKYELCEVILTKPNKILSDIGVTVMDGPFFSIMPFGKTGLHSLTAVNYTPHKTSFNSTPKFLCQKNNSNCSSDALDNCNLCGARPQTAWRQMKQLVKSFLSDKVTFEYEKSLYAIKPLLLDSELDDRRPTLIKEHRKKPLYRSVLSGKINTVYDLEHELSYDLTN